MWCVLCVWCVCGVAMAASAARSVVSIDTKDNSQWKVEHVSGPSAEREVELLKQQLKQKEDELQQLKSMEKELVVLVCAALSFGAWHVI
jgi:hypothetical protein